MKKPLQQKVIKNGALEFKPLFSVPPYLAADLFYLVAILRTEAFS